MVHNFKENPLKFIWNLITSFGGAVGLVSFVQDFLSWKDFAPILVQQYRLIFHWPFDLLPIEIHNSIKDYVFFGLLFIGTMFRAQIIKRADNKWLMLMRFLFWPVLLAFYLISFLKMIIQKFNMIPIVLWKCKSITGFKRTSSLIN